VKLKLQSSSIETFDIDVGDEAMDLNVELIAIMKKMIMRQISRD